MIRRLIRVIVFLFIVYLILHYVDVYAYIDIENVPDILKNIIDFAQETTPVSLWEKIKDLLNS